MSNQFLGLPYHYDRKFHGNQHYELLDGEVSIRDDDTTRIYNKMNRGMAKEFKNAYKAACEPEHVKITGKYPKYFVETLY